MYQPPVLHWGSSFIDKINLDGCRHVLELGCRTGELSAFLANRNSQTTFTAIDALESNIEKSSQFVIPNLQFETLDALLLNAKNHYDAVISLNFFHWVSNKYKVVYNVFQALKPSGKFYLQFIAKHGRPRNDRFLNQIALTSPWKNYFKNFLPKYHLVSASQMVGLLQSFGFIIHRLEFVPYNNFFEHSDQLHSWLKSWASHKERIPVCKQDHFLQQVVNSYINEHHSLPYDDISYIEYLLEIVCEKPNSPILSANFGAQYGSIVFTPHEVNVLKYFLQGKSAKEISILAEVTAKTIEFHIANIKQKLKCHNRSEIYQAAILHGFIELIFS